MAIGLAGSAVALVDAPENLKYGVSGRAAAIPAADDSQEQDQHRQPGRRTQFRLPPILAEPAQVPVPSASDRRRLEVLFGTVLSTAEVLYLLEILDGFGLTPADLSPEALRRQGSRYRPGPPIGVAHSDAFFRVLESFSRRRTPASQLAERDRLLDGLTAEHGLWNRRAVVYGHQEMVVGTVSLLLEAGMIPLLCATPAGSGRLSNILKGMTPEWTSSCLVRQADSLAELETHLVGLRADVLMAGPDAGPLAQRLGLPLVSSVGLSARSASDAGRLRIGYRGALQTIGQLLALFGSR